VLVEGGVGEGGGEEERENLVLGGGKGGGGGALEQRARVCHGQCSGSARDLRVCCARDLSVCVHTEQLGYVMNASCHIYRRVM